MSNYNLKVYSEGGFNFIRLAKGWRRRQLCATISLSSLFLVACSSMEGPEFRGISSTDLLSRIDISERAIMIQNGDSLDLGVSAYSADRAELSIGEGAVRWTSEDSSIVSVTQSGRIKTKKASDISVNIVASYKRGMVTKNDTIPVFVTEDRYDATSARLISLDSNYVGMNGLELFGLPRVRLDLYREGSLIFRGAKAYLAAPDEISLEYRQSFDGEIGNYYLVNNILGYSGSFWIKAVLNLYGTRVADSIEFTGTHTAGITLNLFPPAPGEPIAGSMKPTDLPVLAQPCAVVMIAQFTTEPLDIVFSDSAVSPSGCDTIPDIGFPILKSMGANLLSVPPSTIAVRKSSTKGPVSIWLRDPVTGDSIPYQYRMNQIHHED